MFFNPITKNEIYDIVSKFKNNKSPGIDGIKPGFLKSVIANISDPLCHIFNVSLTTGVFPEKLKLAKVTPIFKNGDTAEFGNYRPISVLSCISKILEKLVFNRTVKFLDKYNLLSDNQYGFRSDYSTSMALLDFADKIVKGFEDNAYSIGIFLDLSKAFDTIKHDILLKKLSFYGIRGIAYSWFESYLTNRKHIFYITHHSFYKSSLINYSVVSPRPLFLFQVIHFFC